MCVCVGVSAARLGFIYSALTKPLHQMGTNRVMEERERKREVGGVCPVSTAMRTLLFPSRPLMRHGRVTQTGCKISLKKERERPQEGLRSH